MYNIVNELLFSIIHPWLLVNCRKPLRLRTEYCLSKVLRWKVDSLLQSAVFRISEMCRPFPKWKPLAQNVP